jgi:hypothetical protein
MIENLIVSGCSFTWGNQSWANIVAEEFDIKKLVNLATPAAGNNYIANSIIDYIETHRPDPENTVVLAMWSGIGRKDLMIDGELWYLLSDYQFKHKYNDAPDSYYIFSGGMGNAWIDHPRVSGLFEPLYLASDPFTICKESLQNFSRLHDYLTLRNYKFGFTSYLNYWPPSIESVSNGDYSLGHFAKDMPAFCSLNFDPWFFIDEQKNSLYEFAKINGHLSADNFHPTALGHKKYSQDIVIPAIKGLFK